MADIFQFAELEKNSKKKINNNDWRHTSAPPGVLQAGAHCHGLLWCLPLDGAQI